MLKCAYAELDSVGVQLVPRVDSYVLMDRHLTLSSLSVLLSAIEIRAAFLNQTRSRKIIPYYQ